MIVVSVAMTVGGFVVARLAYPLKYEKSLIGNAERHQLDPPLLAAIIYEESKFDYRSESPAGAVGLMQLMPETAGWAADELARPELAARLAEPSANLFLGSWYYRYLLDKYENEQLALAAYNGGESNLDTWLAESPGEPVEDTVGRIPFTETRRFVRRVEGTRRIYELLYPELRP